MPEVVGEAAEMEQTANLADVFRSIEIQPIPDIPPAIVDAVTAKKLVVFIGAGVSRLQGCVSWAELASKLLDKVHQYRDHRNRPYLNARVVESLKSNTSDYRKAITICHGILKRLGREDEFYALLDTALSPSPGSAEEDIYRELFKFHAVFLTTNADRLFARQYFADIVCGTEITNENISLHRPPERNILYHLHGITGKNSTLIFTLPQYLKLYTDKDSPFAAFLNHVFREDYIILFVGYGLNELEYLQYLIKKDPQGEVKNYRRFYLQGYYKGEEELVVGDQIYFDELGIKILHFEKDDNGHRQLYYVLKKWAQDITDRSDFVSQQYQAIDEAFEE